MAGDYTPIEHATPRKPEVLRMAAMTGLDRHAIVGWLVEIWAWAGDNSVDGRVDASVDALVDALESHLSPLMSKQSVIRAMVAVDWLEDHGSFVIFPNVDKWISKAAKSRLRKNKRQSDWRDRSQNVDAHVDGNTSTVAPTKEEKRREENNSKKDKGGGMPLLATGEIPPEAHPSTLIPPPIQAVTAYGARMMLPENECRKFVDHFEARGWHCGKARMHNWQAAMRTWASNYRSGTFAGKPQNQEMKNGNPAHRTAKINREFNDNITALPDA